MTADEPYDVSINKFENIIAHDVHSAKVSRPENDTSRKTQSSVEYHAILLASARERVA